jgi:hypothetical protein
MRRAKSQQTMFLGHPHPAVPPDPSGRVVARTLRTCHLGSKRYCLRTGTKV